ncbi:hypothetical protein K1719_015688 [Acacia pycnantha]|nr:hypothetical protein K1719_015688 [Acacia pycnantha]
MEIGSEAVAVIGGCTATFSFLNICIVTAFNTKALFSRYSNEFTVSKMIIMEVLRSKLDLAKLCFAFLA